MKIIHYTLGLPPFRNGGLVNYSIDLAMEQSKDNEVILLYPGEINKKKEIKIKFKKKLELIRIYSIINPLPIPVMFGIKSPEDFMKVALTDEFEVFLRKEKPDIVHIHTLMGLHKEFVEACNKLKIKTIFTTHDYFGICPKVNLVDNQLSNCNNYEEGKKCVQCNRNSLNTKNINRMNSSLYIKLRQNKILNKMKAILKIVFKKINSNKKVVLVKDSFEKSKDYKALREYYFNIFKLIEEFHFNSNISKAKFQEYLGEVKGEVIFITHKNLNKENIKWNLKQQNNQEIRLSFLGNENPIKGVQILLEAFHLLNIEEREKIKISIYGIEKGIIENKHKNIKFKGKYKHKDLSEIFKKTDYTIIPSIWYETFNFVALESKLYRTPVIISNTVGAKDIFEDSEKIEIFPSSIELNKEFIKILKAKEIKKINTNFFYENFMEHSKKIIDISYRKNN